MTLGLKDYDRSAAPLESWPPPVGTIIAVIFAALIAGFAASTLLFKEPGLAAWAVAALIGVALAVSTRALFSASVTRLRLFAWFALAAGMVAYLLPLAFESILPTRNVHLFVLAVVLAFVGAFGIPLAIVLAVIGRKVPVPRDAFAPMWITTALGAGSVIIWLIVFLWTLSATASLSPGVSAGVILLVAVGVPVFCVVPWTYAYDRIISRWAIAPPPLLTRALDELASRTGFRFDRVVCLPASYGAGGVCEVVRRVNGSTLAISESIATDLETESLVAVLAHEAAHIQLRHLRRKLVAGTMFGLVVIGAVAVTRTLFGPRVPANLEFVVGVLPIVLLGNLMNQLYAARVTRRHEAEADAAAVAVSGVDPFCQALEYLGTGPSEMTVHIRWTTHGTREERIARIRALEQRSASATVR